MSSERAAFVPSGAFHLRTPLLPFETLDPFGTGLRAAGALDDPQLLEEALAAEHGPQLSCYALALERATSRAVQESWVFLPGAGGGVALYGKAGIGGPFAQVAR